MDYSKDNGIFVHEDSVQKLVVGLREIKLMSDLLSIRKKANELLKIFEEEKKKEDETPLDEIIYKKMKETTDGELNVKLYMLYRKLQDGKVSEREARRLFELYCGQEYTQGYL